MECSCQSFFNAKQRPSGLSALREDAWSHDYHPKDAGSLAECQQKQGTPKHSAFHHPHVCLGREGRRAQHIVGLSALVQCQSHTFMPLSDRCMRRLILFSNCCSQFAHRDGQEAVRGRDICTIWSLWEVQSQTSCLVMRVASSIPYVRG